MAPTRRPMSRRGAAAVEFVITVPLLILLLFGGLELSLLLERTGAVEAAALVGAQAGAAVREAPPATGTLIEAEAVARAEEALVAHGILCDSGCSVTASWESVDGWWMVRVTIQAPYSQLSSYGWIPGQVEREAWAWAISQD